MTESLQISREGRLLHLALNRPDRRNALNLDLCGALGEALEQSEGDPGVGAVLLSGMGNRFARAWICTKCCRRPGVPCTKSTSASSRPGYG